MDNICPLKLSLFNLILAHLRCFLKHLNQSPVEILIKIHNCYLLCFLFSFPLCLQFFFFQFLQGIFGKGFVSKTTNVLYYYKDNITKTKQIWWKLKIIIHYRGKIKVYCYWFWHALRLLFGTLPYKYMKTAWRSKKPV